MFFKSIFLIYLQLSCKFLLFLRFQKLRFRPFSQPADASVFRSPLRAAGKRLPLRLFPRAAYKTRRRGLTRPGVGPGEHTAPRLSGSAPVPRQKKEYLMSGTPTECAFSRSLNTLCPGFP